MISRADVARLFDVPVEALPDDPSYRKWERKREEIEKKIMAAFRVRLSQLEKSREGMNDVRRQWLPYPLP